MGRRDRRVRTSVERARSTAPPGSAGRRSGELARRPPPRSASSSAHPGERLAAGVGHDDQPGPVAAAAPARRARSTSRLPSDRQRVVVRRDPDAGAGGCPRGAAPAPSPSRSTRIVSKPVRAQPHVDPAAHVAVGGVVERGDEVGQGGVAEAVPGQVGVDARRGTSSSPSQVDQLAEHRVALGVGDRVEVGGGGVDVGDVLGARRDRVGGAPLVGVVRRRACGRSRARPARPAKPAPSSATR